MIDDQGRRVKEAGPSTPVEILGLSDVPNAGEIFVACENDKEARNFAETFVSEGRERLLEETKARMSLDDPPFITARTTALLISFSLLY